MLRSFFLYGLSSAAVTVATLVSHILLYNAVGASQYGFYGQLESLMIFFTNMILFSSDKIYIKEAVNLDAKQHNSYFYSNLTLGLLLWVLLSPFYLLLVDSIVINESWSEYVGVVSLIVTSASFVTMLIYLRLQAITNPSMYAVLRSIRALVFIITILFLYVSLLLSIWSYLVMWFVSLVVVALYFFMHEKSNIEINKLYIKTIFKNGCLLLPTLISGWAGVYGYRILISPLLSLEDIGSVVLAQKIGQLYAFFNITVLAVYLPIFYRKSKEKEFNIDKYSREELGYFVCIYSAVALLLSSFLNFILFIDVFPDTKEVIYLIQYYILYEYFVSFITLALVPYLIVENKIKLITINSILGLVFNLSLIYFLTSAYGVKGLLWGVVLGGIGSTLVFSINVTFYPFFFSLVPIGLWMLIRLVVLDIISHQIILMLDIFIFILLTLYLYYKRHEFKNFYTNT